MSLQRSMNRAAARWVGPGPIRPSGFVPVVSFGGDRIDLERGVWVDGAEFDTSGTGNAPSMRIDALTGDVELVALGVLRPGGDVAVGWRWDDAFATTTLGQPAGNAYADAIQTAVAYSQAAGATVGMLGNAVGRTLWLPVEGWIVPAGRSLIVASAAINHIMGWGCAWRTLAPRDT